MKMSQVNHLNTEELLLSCDGELSREHTAHLSRCDDCARRLATVTADLFEIEEALRRTVPANGAMSPAEAWARLVREIRPNVVVFPMRRWVPAIGLAASLLVAVALGNRYLNTADPATPVSEIAATVQTEVSVPAPIVERQASPESLRANATLPVASPKTPEATPKVNAAVMEVAAAQRPAPVQQPLERFGGFAPRLPAAPLAVALASFGSRAPELRAAAETRNVWVGLPAIPPPSVTEHELPSANLDGVQVATLVQTYSTLTKAGFWQEDVRPLWSPSGLWISGTVENAEVRDRIAAALLKSGVSDFSMDVKLRSGQAIASARGDAGTDGMTSRPLGGIVRSSLVSHFGDAARRSFQAPRPEALQSELDRYVTDIFKTESVLLAHAYALQTLVGNVDPHAAGEQALRQFDDMVGFHAAAIRDSEARIYDKLSEALPRRFWSYRSADSSVANSAARSEHVSALLADSLKLDQTLTAMLGFQTPSIDAREANLSCGELLYKIRARVRQIQ
jgi:hypothetical protein